jgi:hypothetical protein
MKLGIASIRRRAGYEDFMLMKRRSSRFLASSAIELR